MSLRWTLNVVLTFGFPWSMCGMTGCLRREPLAVCAAKRFETPAQPRPDTRCGTRRVCQDEPHAH